MSFKRHRLPLAVSSFLVCGEPELLVGSLLPVLLYPNLLSWGEVPGGIKITSVGNLEEGGVKYFGSLQPHQSD